MGLAGTFKAGIQRANLSFADIPANLQTRYDTVKKAIAQTNDVYEQVRQRLIAKIQEWGKQRAVKDQANQQTQKEVQKIWNDLKL
jgi:vacuolar-type H+-ATPase subunit I/STV1